MNAGCQEPRFDGSAVGAILQRELVDAMRSRVLWIFAGIFAALAIGLSAFGLVGAGYAEVTGFARTTASLLNLVLVLLPLIALLLGTASFHHERGALELLLSQPVTRTEVMLGKFLGLGLTLMSATLLGFGAAGVMIAWRAGPGDFGRYLALLGLSCAMELVFLSLAMAIAARAQSRIHALGTAVAVWFVSVLLYDLIVVGAAVLIGAKQLSHALVLGLLFNPVDLVRVLGIIALDSVTAFGATGASLMRMFGALGAPLLLGLALLAWLVLPLLAALHAFRHADL